MKRTLLSLIFILSSLAASAINYEEARQQAWFLTDKMAYELNLTSEQYDRAYQINLDYLMSVNSPNDCSGYYWQYRDTDLRCILFDWQYNLYRTLDYFLRPVRWYQSRWYYPVFDHYRYGYYYFDRPNVYLSYTGGMWRRRSHNDPSPYIAMAPHGRGVGMRDQYRNRNWFGGNDRPNNQPFLNNTQHGERNNHGQVSYDRPHNQGNNKGFRPGSSNTSPNRSYHSDNNRNDNRNNSTTTPYRDAYTNYRQTGNSSNSSGRNFGSGTVNRGGASGVTNGNSTPSGRSTRGTSNTTTGISRNNGGRTFGR